MEVELPKVQQQLQQHQHLVNQQPLPSPPPPHKQILQHHQQQYHHQYLNTKLNIYSNQFNNKYIHSGVGANPIHETHHHHFHLNPYNHNHNFPRTTTQAQSQTNTNGIGGGAQTTPPGGMDFFLTYVIAISVAVFVLPLLTTFLILLPSRFGWI